MTVNFNSRNFRAARKKRGLSQEMLAELADTSTRYVSALENGQKRNPSAILLFQFSDALGVPMEDLMESRKQDEQE